MTQLTPAFSVFSVFFYDKSQRLHRFQLISHKLCRAYLCICARRFIKLVDSLQRIILSIYNIKNGYCIYNSITFFLSESKLISIPDLLGYGSNRLYHSSMAVGLLTLWHERPHDFSSFWGKSRDWNGSLTFVQYLMNLPYQTQNFSSY